jgi:hypothetical protein
MSNRLTLLIAGLVLASTVPAQAQTPQPLAATPIRFESWQPGAPFEPRAIRPALRLPHRHGIEHAMGSSEA